MPAEAYIFNICQRIGFSPIGVMGFGKTSETSRILDPFPPQRITAFIIIPFLYIYKTVVKNDCNHESHKQYK
jgi:hypothetical protein